MQPDSQQIREGSAASGTPLFLYALEQSFQRVGGDAHIDPAIRNVFSKISGEFVTALGAMWASPPTQYMEDSRSDVGIFSTYTELIFTQATE